MTHLVRPRYYGEPIHEDAPGFNPNIHKDLIEEINEVLDVGFKERIAYEVYGVDPYQYQSFKFRYFRYVINSAWFGSGTEYFGFNGLGFYDSSGSTVMPLLDKTTFSHPPYTAEGAPQVFYNLPAMMEPGVGGYLCGPGPINVSSTSPVWVSFDFGKEVEIDKFRFGGYLTNHSAVSTYTHPTAGRSLTYQEARSPRSGVLLGSNDGLAWENVMSFADNPPTESPSEVTVKPLNKRLSPLSMKPIEDKLEEMDSLVNTVSSKQSSLIWFMG